MTEDASNNTQSGGNQRNPYDDLMYLSTSDFPGMQLRYNNGLGAKNKHGFLDGKVAMPEATSATYSQWLRCDNMIRCWLINSMEAGIKDGFMSVKSTKQLWSEILERNISQDNSSVAEYFNKLKRHWDEIEEIECIPDCTCGVMAGCTCSILKKLVESASKEKFMVFLMGLHESYDTLRTNILSMEPIPTLNKAYSFVQQIESQRNITNVLHFSQDVSALATDSKITIGLCNHCRKKGHTRETCFRMHPELRSNYMTRNTGQRFQNQKFSANKVEVDDDMPFDLLTGRQNMAISPNAHGQGDKQSSVFSSEQSRSLQCTSEDRCKVHSRIKLLHARLGHTSPAKLLRVADVHNGELKSFVYDTCVLAKLHKFPFERSVSRAENAFELIHIDLWGPYMTPLLTGAHYFLTIVDDHTRVTWMFLLKTKLQVYSLIKEVKIIRSDNGIENVQNSCLELFASRGIIHQKSVPGVPQQNGRVERKHRHLVETAKAIMINAGLPKRFWGECLLGATYIINKLPSSVLDWKVPAALLLQKPVAYDEMRVIGCLCFALVHSHQRDKFDPKGRKCVFLSYPHGQKAYKVYDLETHKILISRDVVFHEQLL
ncbi:hypothetical protein RND81_05G014800 [Saponaria officinalis]|uniref:Integrase catalytic domain-containing protein n=1 Tax=Saponaria officinalis TaxID=3572 RepID=A0AAW1KUF2_SAPOF